MIPLLLLLVNASIFSLQGLGEDLGVYELPFVSSSKFGRIQFIISPEFTVLNESRDFRGIFWTNPFQFKIAVPVYEGFFLSAGNRERFNQNFDLYAENSNLRIHLLGSGGIEEIYGGVNKLFPWGGFAVQGSYLFGKNTEVWNYFISDYTIADTFTMTYEGFIFSAGIRLKIVDIAYEFLGSVTQKDDTSSSEIDFPERLSIGVSPDFKNIRLSLLFEHSFWEGDEYLSPNRFRCTIFKDNLSISYSFNPWYLSGVQENRLDLNLNIPIKKVGLVTAGLSNWLRCRGSIREFKFVPELKFTIRELFARRRR
ncbi:hypothetical protein BXT86_01850 [candidate division WOR-3 bacterium 4484_100]|uniref:DUF5723 domain-containing protein n=1 Tax=candidate division WOR-3 bacterium 4484_100 TaxID=1936077 RepID=A0A1V4QH26_UNCW3|nr:MAG: hypothetical protein BXT86_01850 [candidate division WOR-3 bacterium 4484_100]